MKACGGDVIKPQVEWFNLPVPDFMDQLPSTVLVNCRWSREVRSKRFRTRQTAVTCGRVFLLLQFQFVQGLPGGGSVWRAAQMIRDPRQTPPWHRWSKARWSVVGMAGRVDVGPIRQGNAGGSDRSAGRDRLRSNPLVRKKEGVPTSTRTHPHIESAQHPRARITHVTHLRLARVPMALCYVSVCE